MAMKTDWYSCDGDGQPASTRRSFLRSAALVGTAGVWWAGAKSALSQVAVRGDRSDGNVIVVIFLRGGADALNIVAPYAEDAYYRERPTLGLRKPNDKSVGDSQRLADLDGFFGLTPALSPLLPFYRDGELAIVHAVGSGDTTHSHFEAMSTMERGLRNQTDATGGGWLGRHLKAKAGSASPLRAVAFSSIMPDSLGGATSALAVESLEQFRLSQNDAQLRSAIGALYRDGDDAISRSGRETLKVLESLQKVNPAAYQPDHGAVYPNHFTGDALRQVAFLIKQDLGLEVACLDIGGWDTHVAQGQTEGWLPSLLGDLGRCLAAFRQDMGGEMAKVTVVIQSEFGRRLAENSGFGTDHGAGGLMMALGGGVKGGKVYGDWPGLEPAQLTGPGDLKITTDYRSVLSELLDRRLATPDLATVFPGFRPQPMNIFAT